MEDEVSASMVLVLMDGVKFCNEMLQKPLFLGP